MVRRATLDNGLTVLVQEEHTAPLASVWCWAQGRVERRAPWIDRCLALVRAHELQGHHQHPARSQVKGIIEEFGGSWNGYTWIDQTTYLETATRDALDRMLFIEAERMANGLFHPDDCEAERTIIISELEGGENDPDQLLDQELTATAFKAHGYRHPTIGWLSDLRVDDSRRFVWLLPPPLRPRQRDGGRRRRCEHGRCPAADRTLLWRHPAGVRHSARGVRTIEPEQTGERRLEIRKEGTTAYLKAAFHAPAFGHPDFFPTLVLDAALTGAKGLNLWSSFRGVPPQRRARLYRTLVERGLASSVGGALLPTEHPFLYTLSVTVTDGTPIPEVRDALLDELERVRREGIDDSELTKAKAQLKSRLVFDNDSITDIAHQLGYFATIASVDSFLEAPARIAAVTLEEVSKVAEGVLKPSNRTVGWFEPVG